MTTDIVYEFKSRVTSMLYKERLRVPRDRLDSIDYQ